MKMFVILLVLFPVLCFGQCGVYYQGILSAQVFGDTVILHEDTAQRNCGAEYQMKAYVIADTLYWLQYDTGQVFGCLCTFNLSVTIDSLSTGFHTAKVYYSEPPWSSYPDTCYVGLIPFEITKQNSYTSIHNVKGIQSDCFGWNSIEIKKNSDLFLHLSPCPVIDYLNITTNVPGEKTIVICDIQNKIITTTHSSKSDIKINLGFLSSGMYIVTVNSSKATQKQKFCKF